MENEIEMNEKKKAKYSKMQSLREKLNENPAISHLIRNILIFIIFILVVLSVIFAVVPDFKGSYPLSRLFTGILIIIGLWYLILCYKSKDLYIGRGIARYKIPEHIKKNPLFNVFLLLVRLFFLGALIFVFVKMVIPSIYDLAMGPQEIMLEDAKTYKKHSSGYRTGGTHYYLSGKTEEGTTVKIAMTKDKFEEMSAIIIETDPITISYYKGLNEFYDLGSRPQKFVLEDARPVKAVNRNDETICYLTGKKEDGTTVKIAISHDKFEEIKEVTKKNDTIIVHYLLGSDGFFEIEVVE